MPDTRHCDDPLNVKMCEDYGPSDILVSCSYSSVKHIFGIFFYVLLTVHPGTTLGKYPT